MNTGFHGWSCHVLPHKIQTPIQKIAVLLSPPLLCVGPSQIGIVAPSQHATPIIHITDKRLCATATVLADVRYKDVVCFAGVESFVWAVLSIFILVTADDWCDVGTAFEAPIMQGVEHLFGVWELGFAMCKCAIIVLQVGRSTL